MIAFRDDISRIDTLKAPAILTCYYQIQSDRIHVPAADFVRHSLYSLQWRHDEHDGSIHQPHDCLLNRLFRGRSKKTSKLRVTGLCAGNSPHKWPVTRKKFPFDDVIMLYRVYDRETIVGTIIQVPVHPRQDTATHLESCAHRWTLHVLYLILTWVAVFDEII